MSIPGNVVKFEALFYGSLFIDTVSAAFDPSTFADLDGSERAGFMVVALGLLGFVLYLVWLAGQRAQNWARWALTALVVMSAWAYLAELQDKGFGFSTLVDTLSLVLSALGIYFAFTGDAVDWFRRGQPV